MFTKQLVVCHIAYMGENFYGRLKFEEVSLMMIISYSDVVVPALPNIKDFLHNFYVGYEKEEHLS